jgi:hypothetical protein
MKKCLRCGAIYKVKRIINIGEIVNGLSNAIKKMKQRQHEIAIKQLGNIPEFNSFQEFKIAKPQGKYKEESSYKENIDDLNSKFISILEEIQRHYSSFPLFVIQLKAEEYGIPKEELQILIKRYLLNGWLIKTKEGHFTFKK